MALVGGSVGTFLFQEEFTNVETVSGVWRLDRGFGLHDQYHN